MYTPTQNYGLAMPSYGDEADIGVINDMVTAKVDELLFQNRTISAPPFETTEAYAEGDLVVYENVLYRFTADKTAGAWDSSKVVQTSLAAEIEDRGSGASALSDLTDTDIDTPADGEVLTWDGEKWVNAEGTPAVTKTASGNPIEFEDGADAPLVKCTTAITGSQDLHGYDKPWVGGAGRNKWDEEWENGYLGTSGQFISDGNSICSKNYIPVDANNTYFGVVPSGKSLRVCAYDSTHTFISFQNVNNATFTLPSNASYIKWSCYNYGTTYNNDVAINYPATVTTYSPYSNICPITAYTEGEIVVSDGDGNVTTHTATFSNPIYQGNADFVGGSASCDMPCIDLGSFNYSVGTDGYFYSTDVLSDSKAYGAYEVCNAICSIAEKSSQAVVSGKYVDCAFAISVGKQLMFYISAYAGKTGAEIKTLLTGQTLAYELATPPTSSVTPTNLPIKSLFGYNHIESSTGEMEVEYITENYQPLVDLIQNSKHVYSTQEQVVGKWVDGKDVYEKTYTFSSLPAVSDWTAFDEDCEIDTLVDYSCMYTRSNGQTDNNSDLLRVAYNPPNALGDLCYYPGGVGATHITVRYTKATATTRNLSKGTTDGLKAEISEVKDEGEEILKGDEKALKIDESEDTETKETDETEGNADEVQNETVTE